MRDSRGSWAVAALVWGAACACAPGEAASGWRGSIDTLPNGTVVVRNQGSGLWDSATAWRVVEDLRIGNAEGEGNAGFNQVSALAVDLGGRMYVLEQTLQEIRVFDATGAFVRRIGRKGSGPAEFRNASGMGWDGAGRLWVVDPGNGRAALFDTAGRFVGTRPRPTFFYMVPWTGAFLDSGDLLDVVALPGSVPPALALARYDSASVSRDTIPLPSYEEARFTFQRSGQTFMTASVPYAPGLAWRIDPRGFVWFGVTAPYRIYQRRLNGDTVRILELAYTPLPVSEHERAEAIDGLDWFVKQGGAIDASRIPLQKPAFERFYLDDAGRLWVVPEMAEGDTAGGTPLDVFDEAGRYLGRLRLPWRISGSLAPVFRRERLYAVTNDADGVPFVVRARIERPRLGH